MNIDKKLKDLQRVELKKPDSVLSMYLNTDPADPDQQGGEWKIQLKNGLNSFDNYLENSGDSQELKRFKQVRKKVERFLYENHMNLQKSVVIFATADESVWFAETLQMTVQTEFHWQESPIIDQLYQLKSLFPRTGVILVRQGQVKIIEAQLGTILETKHYQLDKEIEEWVPFVEKAENEEQQKSLDGNQKRWYKRLAPKLDKIAKKNNWERIYLVGDKEETKDIDQYMNKKVDKLENKNILDHEETQIIETVVA